MRCGVRWTRLAATAAATTGNTRRRISRTSGSAQRHARRRDRPDGVSTELVRRRGLPVERFVALTAGNPARLNGIHPQKGVIAPGSDADLILIDPAETRTVSAAALHMATDDSPYEGQELARWQARVIVAGRVLIDDGAFGASRAAAGLSIPARCRSVR